MDKVKLAVAKNNEQVEDSKEGISPATRAMLTIAGISRQMLIGHISQLNKPDNTPNKWAVASISLAQEVLRLTSVIEGNADTAEVEERRCKQQVDSLQRALGVANSTRDDLIIGICELISQRN